MRVYTKAGGYKNRWYYLGRSEPKKYKYKAASKGQRGFFNSYKKAKSWQGF